MTTLSIIWTSEIRNLHFKCETGFVGDILIKHFLATRKKNKHKYSTAWKWMIPGTLNSGTSLTLK